MQQFFFSIFLLWTKWPYICAVDITFLSAVGLESTPGQFEVLFVNTKLIACFDAVNLPDQRCLHPC